MEYSNKVASFPGISGTYESRGADKGKKAQPERRTEGLLRQKTTTLIISNTKESNAITVLVFGESQTGLEMSEQTLLTLSHFLALPTSF